MLSFSRMRGMFSQTAFRRGCARRKSNPQPGLESLEGRLLMCSGGCHWHASALVQTAKPSSLTTTAEVAYLAHLNWGVPGSTAPAPIHVGGMEDLVAHRQQTLNGCGCVSSNAVSFSFSDPALTASHSPRLASSTPHSSVAGANHFIEIYS
jgi:hypothetical protein